MLAFLARLISNSIISIDCLRSCLLLSLTSVSRFTVFLRLSEEERLLLFRQYAKSRELAKRKILKTRKEGNGNSKCEELRQAAYTQAEADYNNAIAKCKAESPTTYCYTQALAKYERSKRTSDRVYEECIKK